ncbi:hypothetical protein ACHAPT_002698 [Fusarium lateritium]
MEMTPPPSDGPMLDIPMQLHGDAGEATGAVVPREPEVSVSSSATAAQASSSNGDLYNVPEDSSAENLLQLQSHLERESTSTGNLPAGAESQDEGSLFVHDSEDEDFETFLRPNGGLEAADDNDESGPDARDDGDSDFNPEEMSDSEESDGPASRQKQNSSRLDAGAASQLSERFEELKAARNQLIIKQASEELEAEEAQRLELLEAEFFEARKLLQDSQVPNDKTSKQKKGTWTLPKTARQYWQNRLQKDAEKDEQRRKQGEQSAGPRKARKTSLKSSPGKKGTWRSAKSGAKLLDSLDDAEESVEYRHGPDLASIKATTHKDLFAQYSKVLEGDFDTRHTKSQRADLKIAISSFGYKKVKVVDGGHCLLSGITTPLMNHQLVAASWMVEREAKEWKPPGGLLGDEMGVGKTLTALACITGHPAAEEDLKRFRRATLFVVPSQQVAKQVLAEVQAHCDRDNAMKTAIYSRSEDRHPESWGDHWLVITTYRELVAQCPSRETMKKLKTEYGKGDRYEQELRQLAGNLYRIPWYRVVLDEAHCFKNPSSQTAHACWKLESKYRWTLSGTPISNTVHEFFPYLKFIRADFAGDFRKFRDRYVTAEDAAQNFEALISLIMYRRTQTDTFLGQPVADIPASHTQVVWTPLQSYEVIANTAVDNYFKRLLPKGKKKHDLVEEFETVQDGHELPKNAAKLQYARFQKLRQAASHPFNLEKFFREKLRQGDMAWMQTKLEELSPQERTFSELLGRLRQAQNLKRYSAGFDRLAALIEDDMGGI